LKNDTEADGYPLSATLVSGVSHGALAFNSDGSFAYTPNPNFIGIDTFTYTANDGVATSAVATVYHGCQQHNDIGHRRHPGNHGSDQREDSNPISMRSSAQVSRRPICPSTDP